MNVEAYNNTAKKYRRVIMLQLPLGLKPLYPFFNPMVGIQDELVLGSLENNAELAPHTGDMNYQDALKFDKRTLKVYTGDCSILENPEVLRTTILGRKLVGNSKAGSKHPLELEILTTTAKTVSGKLRMSLFQAKRKADGTKTMDLFNGFDTITEKEIADGNISVEKKNLINVAAITKANVIDSLKAIYNAATDELKEKNTVMYLPYSIYDLYQEAYLEERGATALVSSDNQVYLEGSDGKCKLKPFSGKKQDIIQLTVPQNMVIGTDQESDKEFMEVRRGENAWKWQFNLKAVFGVEFDTIHPFYFLVAKIGD